jgi:hypothetical protein
MKKKQIQESLIDDRLRCSECKQPLSLTALGCKACLLRKYERESLGAFLRDPHATFRVIVRGGKGAVKKHAIIAPWGRKTLCGKKLYSISDAGQPRSKDQLSRAITCSECLRVAECHHVEGEDSDEATCSGEAKA